MEHRDLDNRRAAAVDNSAARDELVAGLQRAVARGSHGFEDVPPALRIVLESESWKERPVRARGGDPVGFTHFEQFVEAPLPDGLGITMETLRDLCRKDIVLLDWLDKATAGRQGERTDLFDNIKDVSKAPTGTSQQQALRKLRKDRPDLHERVLSRGISAHAAMVEAGYRPKTVTHQVTPDAFARAARKHLTEDEIDQMFEMLKVSDGA
jgi:hypothetical protein